MATTMKILALLAMAGISMTQFLGIGIAGVSVFIGISFFFMDRAIHKTPFSERGLHDKAIGSNLTKKKIWIWILLPTLFDALSIAGAILVLPGFIDHVLRRTDIVISFENVFLILVQVIVLAVGEEIAWRAFFQKQLTQWLPIIPSLLITSVLFAIGHIASGDPIIVVYDIFFIFVNSMVYGIIFNISNNAWLSAISHCIANIFSIIVLLLL